MWCWDCWGCSLSCFVTQPSWLSVWCRRGWCCCLSCFVTWTSWLLMWCWGGGGCCLSCFKTCISWLSMWCWRGRLSYSCAGADMCFWFCLSSWTFSVMFRWKSMYVYVVIMNVDCTPPYNEVAFLMCCAGEYVIHWDIRGVVVLQVSLEKWMWHVAIYTLQKTVPVVLSSLCSPIKTKTQTLSTNKHLKVRKNRSHKDKNNELKKAWQQIGWLLDGDMSTSNLNIAI